MHAKLFHFTLLNSGKWPFGFADLIGGLRCSRYKFQYLSVPASHRVKWRTVELCLLVSEGRKGQISHGEQTWKMNGAPLLQHDTYSSLMIHVVRPLCSPPLAMTPLVGWSACVRKGLKLACHGVRRTHIHPIIFVYQGACDKKRKAYRVGAPLCPT